MRLAGVLLSLMLLAAQPQQRSMVRYLGPDGREGWAQLGEGLTLDTGTSPPTIRTVQPQPQAFAVESWSGPSVNLSRPPSMILLVSRNGLVLTQKEWTLTGRKLTPSAYSDGDLFTILYLP